MALFWKIDPRDGAALPMKLRALLLVSILGISLSLFDLKLGALSFENTDFCAPDFWLMDNWRGRSLPTCDPLELKTSLNLWTLARLMQLLS